VFAPGADISDEPVKGMRAKLIDAAGAVFGRWTPWVRALPRIWVPYRSGIEKRESRSRT
jgi:hypothetical protein